MIYYILSILLWFIGLEIYGVFDDFIYQIIDYVEEHNDSSNGLSAEEKNRLKVQLNFMISLILNLWAFITLYFIK